MVGCSPDRIVETARPPLRIDRIVEIKTHPGNPGIQVHQMRERAIDPKHNLQVQGQLWLCEADYADIVNYTPGFPTVTARVGRDEQIISALKLALAAFVETLLNARAKLTREYVPFSRVRPAPTGEMAAIVEHFRPVI
jgi:hypothetical protein